MNSTDMTDNNARPTVSAGLLCFNEHGHALFVNPTYKPFWNLPGGHVEQGETPATAAVREGREELGIDVEVGPLLATAWITVPGRGEQVLFVFDGGELSPEQQAAITVQESELSEHAFFPTDDIDPAVAPPHLLGLLRSALRARAEGGVAYLEVSV
ncbi:NUDIX hydrolase [Streptomyces sp. RKAG293]|uniref:NUDIX domain-containing protein n=1 Tax=Streptomyces sp. RKAG293 TaxID=2893403 RepID=UPI00203373C8|nr:NUDIX hydrolase [Streptomyces sp. RKAG293]MCM2417001.1 NUDIX hydrolase [Streptomyces sp. RKAG293]